MSEQDKSRSASSDGECDPEDGSDQDIVCEKEDSHCDDEGTDKDDDAADIGGRTEYVGAKSAGMQIARPLMGGSRCCRPGSGMALRCSEHEMPDAPAEKANPGRYRSNRHGNSSHYDEAVFHGRTSLSRLSEPHPRRACLKILSSQPNARFSTPVVLDFQRRSSSD
jgi:hypothetical protein